MGDEPATPSKGGRSFIDFGALSSPKPLIPARKMMSPERQPEPEPEPDDSDPEPETEPEPDDDDIDDDLDVPQDEEEDSLFGNLPPLPAGPSPNSDVPRMEAARPIALTMAPVIENDTPAPMTVPVKGRPRAVFENPSVTMSTATTPRKGSLIKASSGTTDGDDFAFDIPTGPVTPMGSDTEFNKRQNVTLPSSSPVESVSMAGMPDQATSTIVMKKEATDYFEESVCGTLDRSLSNLKRAVGRDIGSVLRTTRGIFDVSVFDAFSTDLVNELAKVFEPPEQATGASEAPVARRLTSAFEEGAKPVRRLMQESEARVAQVRDRRIDELKQLAAVVNELRASAKGLADATFEELERERLDAVSRRDEEQTRARSLDRLARTLRLKHTDLESRSNHQKMEKQSVERLLKQIDEARGEWEESRTGASSGTGQRLQKEIKSLRTELSGDANETLELLIDECASLMASVRNDLHDEICQMDAMERWQYRQRQGESAQVPSPYRTPPRGRLTDRPF